MCLFIECAPGYHNSSSSCSHPQSSLPFCFWPHLLPCPPLLSAVFSPLLRSFQPSSLTHSLPFPLSLLPPSPPLLSIQITRFHFSTPSSLWIVFSSSLYPFLPVLPSLYPPQWRTKDGLIAVWCAFAGLRATQLSSVRLVINCLCFYSYMANTSEKVKYITLTIKAQYGG